jgi:radical SAM protein with 4Fe4S-binding SPASM domain
MVYKKHHSFENFVSKKKGVIEYQNQRALRVLDEYLDGKLNLTHAVHGKKNFRSVLSRAQADLKKEADPGEGNNFRITQFIAEEMSLYDDAELVRFLYHRYRYDIFPLLRELDEFPPYVQIEPTSICNYRCVFCYQTDLDFFSNKSGRMGSMSIDSYRNVVEQIVGHVEFLSLASRGEPLIAKEIDEMLEYSVGKFLNLKLNTNASLLNERHIHAILAGGVRTVVFSADAATEPLYSQLRVNGKLDRVLKNIELFQKIRERDYGESKILTRVSGVQVSEDQAIEDMQSLWGGLVDQIAFVNYNPWENIYESEPNNLEKPCSDLWRRMFVWFDGAVNPCDSDYRSTLAMGNLAQSTLADLWHSQRYQDLRRAHEENMRQIVEPCKRCAVT